MLNLQPERERERETMHETEEVNYYKLTFLEVYSLFKEKIRNAEILRMSYSNEEKRLRGGDTPTRFHRELIERELQKFCTFPSQEKFTCETVLLLQEFQSINDSADLSHGEKIKAVRDLKSQLLELAAGIMVPVTVKNEEECCSLMMEQYTDCLFCPVCSKSKPLLQITAEGADLPYSERYRVYETRSKPAYKRSGHLRTKIQQKLATLKVKELPSSVVQKVEIQLQRERIIELSNLKTDDIRRILKKLGLQKYYDMEYTIFSRITGIKPIEFDNVLISKIEGMFDSITHVFNQLPNKGRTSMFVYDYTIHKILEVLDLHIYKQHFKPPKNPDKVLEYDAMWKQICARLRWDFIPTSLN